MNLMLISACPRTAAFAVECGVDCIFVDLEIEGKAERQAGLSTVISRHSLESIPEVRSAAPNAELLVRINPVSDRSAAEIDAVIERGADVIMLPMFSTIEELDHVSGCIRGRARLIPLVEVPAALVRIEQVAQHTGVDEVYMGLNDMHLAMRLDFMFELVSEGWVDIAAAAASRASKPFGFGGLAKLDAGLVPGYKVLAEHARLGSSRVILSRDFHGSSSNLEELQANVDLRAEVQRVRAALDEAHQRTPEQVEADRRTTADAIRAVAKARSQARRAVVEARV